MTYSDVCAAVWVIEILVFQQLSVRDVWEAACKSRLAAEGAPSTYGSGFKIERSEANDEIVNIYSLLVLGSD